MQEQMEPFQPHPRLRSPILFLRRKVGPRLVAVWPPNQWTDPDDEG